MYSLHLVQTIVHLFSHHFTRSVPFHCHRLPVTIFLHICATLHGRPCCPAPTHRFLLISSMSLHVSHRGKTYTAFNSLIHTFHSSRQLSLFLNAVSLGCPPTPTLISTSKSRAYLFYASLPIFVISFHSNPHPPTFVFFIVLRTGPVTILLYFSSTPPSYLHHFPPFHAI